MADNNIKKIQKMKTIKNDKKDLPSPTEGEKDIQKNPNENHEQVPMKHPHGEPDEKDKQIPRKHPHDIETTVDTVKKKTGKKS